MLCLVSYVCWNNLLPPLAICIVPLSNTLFLKHNLNQNHPENIDIWSNDPHYIIVTVTHFCAEVLKTLGYCLRFCRASLPTSCKAKSKLYCGPYGHTASIFHGIWIKQSGAMVFIFNLDKVLLKKLFPTMNI